MTTPKIEPLEREHRTSPVLPVEPVAGEPAGCRVCRTPMTQTTPGGPWETTAPADGHEHVAVRVAWLEQWRRGFDVDPVGALLGLVDEYGAERAVETFAAMDGGADADVPAARARAARAQLGALLGDPAVLRAIGEHLDHGPAGHVQVHQGRGENLAGVPRRMLAGSLEWEPYDGGEWVLRSYGHTREVGERDVAGAQAWAAQLIADGREPYNDDGATVVRWAHHRDDYGDWWEPVTSGER